jgi:hypothetical protein
VGIPEISMRPTSAAALAAASLVVLALPAAAQTAAPTAGQARQTAPRQPAAAPGTAQVAGTPGTGGTRTVDVRSPDVEASIKRAQKAADDRAKAWDAKMKRTMGSICGGC